MTDVRVIRSTEREIAEADATSGMVREQALSGGGVWTGLVRTAPGAPSGWHHHGENDTNFYVANGRILMEFGPGGAKHIEAGHGDFVHVPRGVVHRERNPAVEEGAVVLFRVGTGPAVVNVEGPD